MGIRNILTDAFFSGTAIYISDDFVDIARATHAVGGMRVNYLQRFPMAKNIKNLSYSDFSDELERIIDKAFPDQTRMPHRLAVNITDNHLILRRFTMRTVQRKEFSQAVIFEAQKYITTPIDMLTYSYRTTPMQPGNNEVVFVASETKNIKSALDFFRAKKMSPGIIESVPILLARYVSLQKNYGQDAAYMFIHYEPSRKVTICEIAQNYPHFFRDVDISGGEESSSAGELVYPTLKDAWPSIERDVISGIEYIQKETGQRVQKIIVSGFTRGPDEASISAELGVSFERPNLSIIQQDASQDMDRHFPALMLLYDSLNTPYLNIAPEETAYSDVTFLKPVIFYSVIALAIVMLAHIGFMGFNGRKTAELARLKGSLTGFETFGVDTKPEEINYIKNIISERANIVNRFISRRHSLSYVLSRLGEIMPENCWIESISYRCAVNEQMALTLNMRGSFFSDLNAGSSEANRFLERLKADKKLKEAFVDIQLLGVQKREQFKKEIASFEISMK